MGPLPHWPGPGFSLCSGRLTTATGGQHTKQCRLVEWSLGVFESVYTNLWGPNPREFVWPPLQTHCVKTLSNNLTVNYPRPRGIAIPYAHNARVVSHAVIRTLYARLWENMCTREAGQWFVKEFGAAPIDFVGPWSFAGCTSPHTIRRKSLHLGISSKNHSTVGYDLGFLRIGVNMKKSSKSRSKQGSSSSIMLVQEFWVKISTLQIFLWIMRKWFITSSLLFWECLVFSRDS